tara:strand:+ start:4259 stop:4423 length:165 start_codon:yes stop_codon:yes gene_type:complete
MSIIKKINSRTGGIHLYNPKKEGLGSYDVNYINAYQKKYRTNQYSQKENERYAA